MANSAIREALMTIIKSKRRKLPKSQRRRPHKPTRWLYPWATENRYAATIRAWLRPMKEYVHQYIKENQEAILRGDSSEFRADSISVARLDAVPGGSFIKMINSLNGWMGQYAPEQGELFDEYARGKSPIYMGLGNIADSVFDFNERQYEKGAKSALGIEFPVGEDWWPDAHEIWRKRNYDIIRSDMKNYIAQVNDLTEKAVTSGLSVKELSKQIMSLDDKITKGRANFIARDQIGKLNGEITQRRMESVGLTMYIWETSGDERVRSTHAPMDGLLCRWDDATVYSDDGGKAWKARPTGAVLLHPGQDYQCRCTAIAYWEELVGEADAVIDYEERGTVDKEVQKSLKNYAAEEKRKKEQAAIKKANKEQIEKNRKKSYSIIEKEYPDEKWISSTDDLQSRNKYTKALELAKNVSVSDSRVPMNNEEKRKLTKELKQANKLASFGNVVYLIPEFGNYKQRMADAIVNGTTYEFKNITGNSRSVEKEFSNAKKKGADINVYMNIVGDIPVREVRRRIAQVLEKHPNYTGEIIVTFESKETYFWETEALR
jgi:SPP1 gp7 family putative phage head morphogenesis protein